MTLARRHFERTAAAVASAAADAGEPIHANAYELLLAKLAEDKRRLKDIQSIERKIEVKRQLLPEYSAWVEGALEAGRGGQDVVLMTVMVWRVDTGDFLGALQIAKYALEHGLVMPDQYQRDVATLITEEIAEQALVAINAGTGFDYTLLQILETLTADRDMPDQVRAKLHKALGLIFCRLAGSLTDGSVDVAYATASLEHLQRAVQLHERCGVKKEIERLERALRNRAASAAPETGADESSSTGKPDAEQSNAVERGASEGSETGGSGAPAPATQN